jgi:hypothetical protein
MLRGMTHRIFVPDLAFQRAGSFPASELFSNSDFSNGTVGWTADFGVLSATDNLLKLKASQGGGSNTQVRQAVGLSAFAPYALRTNILDGALSAGLSIGPSITLDAAFGAPNYSTARGYLVTSGVATDATSRNQFAAVFSSTSGFTADAFILTPFTSLSRCFQVDAAGNLLPRSDEIDNAAWTKSGCTITANGDTAADGTSTAEVLVENGATSAHYVSQAATVTSSAQDLSLSAVVRAVGRNFCWLQMDDGTSIVTQFFSLTSTGAVGASGTTGGTWANRRAFVRDLGNGRILCTLIARKTGAATAITNLVGAASADGTSSYTGSGGNAIHIWRATAWPSSVATRVVQSTSAAIASQTQSGSAIYVKGLPASTSGLLKVGDAFEVDKQMKFVTVALDSDSAGNGYLLFEPPLARALADNTPIIVQNPLCKMVMTSDAEYENPAGNTSNFQFDFEQDLTP